MEFFTTSSNPKFYRTPNVAVFHNGESVVSDFMQCVHDYSDVFRRLERIYRVTHDGPSKEKIKKIKRKNENSRLLSQPPMKYEA